MLKKISIWLFRLAYGLSINNSKGNGKEVKNNGSFKSSI